ncbi:hypothetical protein MKZ20_03500 [Psychrobacillus sp. FSL K6-2684]|uniref:hypothetical protein n=1 Tax=unclassified Psychrobacillus TaxID=2636677 RepID=UPI0012B0EA85|nr:hypothetical protein GI482_13345 [Bacillus sp. N3536]
MIIAYAFLLIGAFNAYLVRYILFEFGFYIEKGKTRRKNYGQYRLAYNVVYFYYVEHCNASSRH